MPEWLLDLFPDRLREVTALEWNRAGERVEAVTSLVFDHPGLGEAMKHLFEDRWPGVFSAAASLGDALFDDDPSAGEVTATPDGATVSTVNVFAVDVVVLPDASDCDASTV